MLKQLRNESYITYLKRCVGRNFFGLSQKLKYQLPSFLRIKKLFKNRKKTEKVPEYRYRNLFCLILFSALASFFVAFIVACMWVMALQI